MEHSHCCEGRVVVSRDRCGRETFVWQRGARWRVGSFAAGGDETPSLCRRVACHEDARFRAATGRVGRSVGGLRLARFRWHLRLHPRLFGVEAVCVEECLVRVRGDGLEDCEKRRDLGARDGDDDQLLADAQDA